MRIFHKLFLFCSRLSFKDHFQLSLADFLIRALQKASYEYHRVVVSLSDVHLRQSKFIQLITPFKLARGKFQIYIFHKSKQLFFVIEGLMFLQMDYLSWNLLGEINDKWGLFQKMSPQFVINDSPISWNSTVESPQSGVFSMRIFG